MMPTKHHNKIKMYIMIGECKSMRVLYFAERKRWVGGISTLIYKVVECMRCSGRVPFRKRKDENKTKSYQISTISQSPMMAKINEYKSSLSHIVRKTTMTAFPAISNYISLLHTI